MKTVIIVGGGASGISCAINLKKLIKDIKVVILEQNEKIGKKILKTGNGKCNLGNTSIEKECYNSLFGYEMAKGFNLNKFFSDIGLLIKEDDAHRLYPNSEAATSVLDCFISELDRLKVEINCNFCVRSISKKNNTFIVSDGNSSYTSDYLVIATGSNSQAKSNGYDLLEALHHKITKLTPVLTPIKTYENTKALQGIRVKCIASTNDFSMGGEILFKDEGLSGILALDLSRHVQKDDKIYLDMLPLLSEKDLYIYLINNLKQRDLEQTLKGILPKMIALNILKKENKVERICNIIKNYQFTVKDLYDYSSSQITKGGVDLSQINSDCSSKIINNLFITGEVLDVDGMCGGYNLMFAFACGDKVANSIYTFEKK